MAYIEAISDSHDWRDATHDFYYPIRDTDEPAPSKVVGRNWDPKAFTTGLTQFAKKLPDPSKKFATKKKKKDTTSNAPPVGPVRPKYPPRKAILDPPIEHAAQTILSNHFELHVGSDELYKYEILDLEEEGRTGKKVQALFRRALDAWPHLSTNKDSFATDGRKTIVSWKKLHGSLTTQPARPGQGPDQEGAIWPPQNITTGNHPTQARFEFVRKVQVARLQQQTLAGIDEMVNDLSAVKRCLDILVSKSFDQNVLRLSANKIFVKSARNMLAFNDNSTSQTLEIMRGYYYDIKPGMGSLLMNFNVSTSAFFRPIVVSEFLADDSTFKSYDERVAILSRLRVYIDPTHSEERFRKLGARIKTVHCIGEEKIEELPSFRKKQRDENGKLILVNGVQQYEPPITILLLTLPAVFTLEKVIKGRPAINCGTDTDPVWYAQEILRIVPYQIYSRPVPDDLKGSMVEQAALSPAIARSLIETEGLRHIGFDEVKESKVQFVNDQCFHFTAVKSLKYYLIQTLDQPMNDHKTKEYMDLFEAELKNQMSRRCQVDPSGMARANPGLEATSLKGNKNLEAHFGSAKDLGVDLVVLMLPSVDRRMYGDFKRLADRTQGLNSICVAKPAQLKGQIGKYMTNVVQKVNFKTGGTNAHVQDISKFLGERRTLILGADVVHPGHLAFEDSPSVACIVGSVDDDAGRFLGSARLQSKDKLDREIIDRVEDMVVERIKDWMLSTGSKEVPANIIYYRDGVSEGQYDKVVTIELSAIRRAWLAVKASNKPTTGAVNLTALVGGKRHHTRFYPIEEADKDPRGNQNCRPGTYVDRLVTSPYYDDFYLQSHSGIKGTARPTHYFPLVNGNIDSCKTIAQIRRLTHHLCYTYCRATGGVSYATPTYYADRLCDRARLYLPKTWSGKAGSDTDFTAHLEQAKTAEQDRRQQARDNDYRNGQPFQTGGVKDQAELDDEIQDTEQIRIFARNQVLDYAKREFYDRATNLDGNSWHTDLAKVMFWM
ncbi:Piwi-domain-containing protein [Setomelanomma holmii]|uniref:Piwi-domain-containing protein n=1 Tax=Setomelanomma holmii TaxID=210430 RepID=A0A9P4H6Y0_9PLEO|nr:Piwi-domain-containing protein [Setomelanomma holmii]